MKSILLLTLILSSVTVSAKSLKLRRLDSLEAKVQALEARVAALESKQGSASMDSTTGLKVEDMNNSTINARGVSGTPTTESLSEEQKIEIQNTIEEFKKSQEKQQKILDEIMNEDI